MTGTTTANRVGRVHLCVDRRRKSAGPARQRGSIPSAHRSWTRGNAALLCLVAWIVPPSGCTASSKSGSPTAVASSDDGQHRYEAELSACVNEINRLRATIGRPAVSRSTVLERYAGRAAEHDTAAAKPHAYALATDFGNGTARAENEALNWPLSYFGAVKPIVERSLAQMWDEGPGGVHYDIMAGDFGEVGCGIYVQGDYVTVLQAYK